MKTGKEIKMSTSYPITSIISRNLAKEYESDEEDSDEDEDKKKELCILKKAKKRRKIGARSAAAKLLKYRGFRHLPLKKHVCIFIF